MSVDNEDWNDDEAPVNKGVDLNMYPMNMTKAN